MDDVVNTIVMPVLSMIVTAVVSYIGMRIKKLLERVFADKTKRDAATTCVRAVEQLYKDLHGEDKFNKCVESLTDMLNEKGIVITELEIKMLIEEAVQKMNEAIKTGLNDNG